MRYDTEWALRTEKKPEEGERQTDRGDREGGGAGRETVRGRQIVPAKGETPRGERGHSSLPGPPASPTRVYAGLLHLLDTPTTPHPTPTSVWGPTPTEPAPSVAQTCLLLGSRADMTGSPLALPPLPVACMRDSGSRTGTSSQVCASCHPGWGVGVVLGGGARLCATCRFHVRKLAVIIVLDLLPALDSEVSLDVCGCCVRVSTCGKR